MNHVDNVESVTSCMRFDFIGFFRGMERKFTVINVEAGDAVPAVTTVNHLKTILKFPKSSR